MDTLADVVVVAYETPRLLDRCLASLTDPITAGGNRVGRVVVIDNSPSDECAEVVRRHGSVELVRPDSNVGFGRGANIGLAATRGGADFVLVLNADTEVLPGAVEALVDHLVAHPAAAIAGPSLVDSVGRVHASCGADPSVWRVFLGQTGLWRPVSRLSRRSAPLANPASSGAVPWVLGAALMLDRRAIEAVGGFDPGFHMYFEEVELARRLRLARREVHFVGQAAVRHVGAASTSKQPDEMARTMYASLARYHRLHGTSRRLAGLRTAVVAICLAEAMRASVRSQPVRPWWRIASDAWRGWPS